MFIIKTTIDEELEHINDKNTPKEEQDILVTLFSKKNNLRLRLLENELLSITQKELTVGQYFNKMKFLYHENFELDAMSKISESRTRRLIIYGLRSKFRGFITAIQGWSEQPALVNLENLLADQETSIKQMLGVSINKKVEEAIYTYKRRG